jgi:hypothetical protein
MPLSRIAALLGLDEVAEVRAVPLTDEELAKRPPATPNRAQRRAAGERGPHHRKQRQLREGR